MAIPHWYLGKKQHTALYRRRRKKYTGLQGPVTPPWSLPCCCVLSSRRNREKVLPPSKYPPKNFDGVRVLFACKGRLVRCDGSVLLCAAAWYCGGFRKWRVPAFSSQPQVSSAQWWTLVNWTKSVCCIYQTSVPVLFLSVHTPRLTIFVIL